MKPQKAAEILKKVEADYTTIAQDFSQNRGTRKWEEFEFFKKYIDEQKKALTVADIGCGNGRLLGSLPKNIHYTGIDNNEALLEEARKNHPGKTFIQGDLLKIPLTDGSQEISCCIAALHHIPSLILRKKAVEELGRITKKDGIIIVTVWNLWQKKYSRNILKALASFFTGGKMQWNDLFIGWKNKVDRYYHAFTRCEFKKLFSENTDLEILEFHQTPHNLCIICKKK
jgi:ubiquinone/menaquinone biosynthesis C-methylase UbiE